MSRTLLFSCCFICARVAVWGHEKTEEADSLELFNRVADEYRFVLKDADRELQRETRPLLRWTNPVRDSNQGVTLLWTNKGRPAVIACLYTYGEDGQSIDHEFQSLTNESLQGTHNDKLVWEPKSPALEWHPLAEAEKPADTPAARLIQMRTLARAFSGVVYQKQDPHDLRLLTQPLYRYADKDDIADGALFAFVQATDPELLLLLEARSPKGVPQWQYALARMTDLPLEVKLGKQQVWSAEAWDWRTRHPSQPYIKFTMSLKR